MQFSLSSLLLGASTLLLAPLVQGQTWSACNPLYNSSCPLDPALGLNHNFVFNTSDTVANAFNITAGTPTYVNDSIAFTVAKKGDSPTIQSQFYIFFGSVSVIMQAAKGQGIISSIVLESDDLDEVDWEFMGGNDTSAETNYFGKGNTTAYDRAIYYNTSSDPRENFHNYTVDWTAERIEWLIDGALVRTLAYADANGGKNFPQTPMTVRMGIWAGGDPDNSNGTIEWAGGLTDYSGGPYTMYIQQAQINDYSTGESYNYTDHTGSWESIKTISGNSTVKNTILQTPTTSSSLSVAQKFKNLSPTTKVGIYAGAGAAGALIFFALMFTCIRQKRKGRAERDAYNSLIEKQRTDAYNDQMELREKGLGGWDKGAFEHQGEDALGGWVGKNGDPKSPTSPSFAKSPTSPNFSRPAEQPFLPGFTHEDIITPAPVRINSPVGSGPMSPIVVSPQAMSPHTAAWGSDAGNGEYQGPFGGNNSQRGLNRNPSFPFSDRSSPAPSLQQQQQQMPPQQRFNTGGGGGYARF